MMSGTPEVSVCITTYNLENQIEETLDSVLAQETPFSFEIIIHDDASTDQTPEILERYRKRFPEQIKTVLQPRNIFQNHPGGMGHIFHSHLLPHASGRYIAICDGDDYWTTRDKLRLQFEIMQQNPGLSGCFTNVNVINEMSGEESLYYNRQKEGLYDASEAILKGGSTASASTIFFDRDRFESSPFFKRYEAFSMHHEYDTLFVYCMLWGGGIYYIDKVTAIYRRWPQGLYSGILEQPEKISAIKEREMLGNLKLLDIAPSQLKKPLIRKISVDALYIIRNASNKRKFRYLRHLTFKEVVKWVTGS